MVHPLKRETNASQASKLSRMTAGYGLADKKDNQKAKIEQHPLGSSGPEPYVGYGADDSRPNQHAARRIRKPWAGNELATYKRGGRVKDKHRDSGGGVSDDTDIEQADINERLSGGAARGGRIKGSLNKDRSHLPSTAMGPGGGKPTKHGQGTKIYPKPVKGGQKYATKSTEPSPTPVLNRAWGGRAGESKGGRDHKGKKGGTHVNIMIAPQHAPGASGAAPVSAMPTPPPMPPKPPGGPPPGAGGPPMGGMPPGGPGGPGMPPGLPPGAVPPGMHPPGMVPPGMLRKHGGRVMKKHHDAAEDAAQIKHMVKSSSLKPHGSMKAAGGSVMLGAGRAAGGRMTHLTAGSYSGEGRLEKAHQNKRIKSQEV